MDKDFFKKQERGLDLSDEELESKLIETRRKRAEEYYNRLKKGELIKESEILEGLLLPEFPPVVVRGFVLNSYLLYEALFSYFKGLEGELMECDQEGRKNELKSRLYTIAVYSRIVLGDTAEEAIEYAEDVIRTDRGEQ